MKRIVGEFSTEIMLSKDEAVSICKLGEGEVVCAFLVVAPDGFMCIRMSYPTNITIFNRLEKGTMIAKGKGCWPGCPWEKKEDEENTERKESSG